MNHWRILRFFGCLLLFLTACERVAVMPTPSPTMAVQPSPTLSPTSTVTTVPSPTLPQTTATPASALPTSIPTFDMQGPFAVVEVPEGDGLNVHADPGVQARIVAVLPPTATDIYLTGASQLVEGTRWAEVQRASDAKLRGWVNAFYLSPYIAPEEFCSSAEMQTIIQSLEQAVRNRDGKQLAQWVSPVHGMTIWLWRSGNPIRFDAEHARWVFDSTYVHNWGMHPASGLETKGSFQEAVLPALEDAFLHSYEVRCNERIVPGLLDSYVVPVQVQNYNLYKILKPGSPGVELDWRIWLVVVEVLEGKPYLTGLIHFQWEP